MGSGALGSKVGMAENGHADASDRCPHRTIGSEDGCIGVEPTTLPYPPPAPGDPSMRSRAMIGILIGLAPLTVAGCLLLAGLHAGVDLSPPGAGVPSGSQTGNLLFVLGMIGSALGTLWLVFSLMWFRVFGKADP
jgi:hypothetical protein